MRPFGFAFAAGLLAIAGGLAAPPSANAEASQPAADLVEQDQIFASTAAASSRMEVELSKLAADKAEDSEVQQFAEQVLQDHREMNKELASILEDMNVPPAAQLTAEAKSDLTRLSKLRGASFDREYMKLMVASHDEAAALFGDESEAGRHAKLKKFAETHLPTIRGHLDHALELDGKLSVATQTPPADPLQSQSKAWQDAARIEQDKPIAERTAADLIQLPVLSEDGDLIGNIKEIVLDRSTSRVYAIIPVGGAMAVSDKDIAIDPRELRVTQDGPRGSLTLPTSEDELEQRPAIDLSDKRYVRYPDDRKLGELGRP